MCDAKVRLLRERLSHTTAAALEAKLGETTAALEAAEAKAAEAKAAGVAARARLKELASQEANLRKAREERLKDLESGTKAAKKALKEAEAKVGGESTCLTCPPFPPTPPKWRSGGRQKQRLGPGQPTRIAPDLFPPRTLFKSCASHCPPPRPPFGNQAGATSKKLKVLGMELSKLVDEVASGEGSVAALAEEVAATKEAVEEHRAKVCNTNASGSAPWFEPAFGLCCALAPF